MVLSLKELPDNATTTAYHTTAQRTAGRYTQEDVLGQSGFAEPDGSIDVRKDFKEQRASGDRTGRTLSWPEGGQ